MKLLIAGYGSIGRRHFRNLLTLTERDILFYRTGHSTLADDELAGYPIDTDLCAALAHQPEAVIVANPTSLHLDVAIPAAEAGCHLLLEKPISHSMDRVDDLIAAVQSGGGKVLVGFQFRFHPALQWIAENQASLIGRPLSFRVHWGEYLPGWHPWEDYRLGFSARADLGGGVILTLCHPLDYLRWLFGEVAELWAFAGHSSDLDLQVEDTAEIGLRFQNGVLGSVHLDYNQRPPTHTLEIIGTEGTIRWDNADGAVRLFSISSLKSPLSGRGAGGEGFLPSPLSGRGAGGEVEWLTYPPPPNFERNDLFLAEMRHFLAIALGEAEPLCTLQDGIQALRLALATHESARGGRLSRLNQ